MLNETKNIKIGLSEFTLVRLEPWRRLTFIADLQKDFFMPLLNGREQKEIADLLDGKNNENFDVMALISGFSGAIDSKSIEKWMKRILNDGLVIYTREDGIRAKLSFSELNRFFTSPVDIIELIKEAIAFNMVEMNELVKLFSPSRGEATKISET